MGKKEKSINEGTRKEVKNKGKKVMNGEFRCQLYLKKLQFCHQDLIFKLTLVKGYDLPMLQKVIRHL